MDERVVLAEYDPAWPEHCQEHAAWLRDALGRDVIALEHIGSTAVPGATAKPIVDVMAGVADAGASGRVAAKLASLGYEDCGGAPGRRYLRMRGRRFFNVQVVQHESEVWRQNLVFRDYLRLHPEAARRYSDAKRAAAERAPLLLAYSELKSTTIRELLREAARELRSSHL